MTDHEWIMAVTCKQLGIRAARRDFHLDIPACIAHEQPVTTELYTCN